MHERVCVCMCYLSQLLELSIRDYRPPPQVVDVDVRGRGGHGGLHVVVVAEGSPGHADGQRHASHPHPRLQGWDKNIPTALQTALQTRSTIP